MGSMGRAFAEGGWAMWPILALGITLVGAGGRLALRGEHQLLGFLRWGLVTLFTTGVFGTASAWMKTLRAAVSAGIGGDPAQELAWSVRGTEILLVGGRESLTPLTFALFLGVVALLLVSVGMRRFPRPNPASFTD